MEYFILFLPLFSSIIAGFFGKFIGDRFSEIITCLFVSISAFLSFLIFFKVLNTVYSNNLVIASWINSGTLNVNWSINIDALSSVMLVVVTLVSSLVHIYSVGYMKGELGYYRFFAYLNLFVFFMLILILGDSFLTKKTFFGTEPFLKCGS